MEIAYSLSELETSAQSYVLTIGNFDGVHRGHKAVLAGLKETAARHQARIAVLTFSNHPSMVLTPERPVPLLCTINHKIRLLEQEQIDLLIIVPFTREFSEQSAETFLLQLRKAIPFTSLVLGSDATLGKNRIGGQETVRQLSKSLEFEATYISDITMDGARVSSSQIRELVKRGQLQQAGNYLGRTFSIYGTVRSGSGRGLKIGFPTANISVEGLCLPPLGVYAVTLKHDSQTYYGVANLGIAPTMRNDQKPLFEVHIFDHSSDLYGQNVEAVFNGYIRPEKRFESIEQLREQIAKDIQAAKLLRPLA